MKWIIIALVILVALIVAAIAGPVMSNVERPKYTVISSEGNIETRQYNAMIIAEVAIEGERKDAITQGFRLLADYIFGNNSTQNKVRMTAPVQQQSNETIAMTAPVQQQASENEWKVSFVMPSEYSANTLPKPVNNRVKIKEIPEQTFVAISFSGLNSNENIAMHEQQLMQYVEKCKLEAISTYKYAFYNPPWTLPFLRRNEIMVQIKNN